MLTLSTNFENILKKTGSIQSRYIVKIARTHSSTYVGSNFYFSDSSGDITDSGTYPLRPILKSDINIIQKIDFREHKSSVGGFSIKLIDDGLSDDLNTYWIYNREVKIYFGDASLSDLSDYLLLYTGIVKDYSVDRNVITIKIENSTFTVQKELPQNYIDGTESRFPFPDNLNKPKQLVYGDHIFYYGKQGTSLSVTHEQDNNLVKCIYLGKTAAGKNKYLIANHDLKKLNDVGYQTWMFDQQLQKYVKIDSSNVTYTLSGNDYYLEIDDIADCYFYDYRYPNGTVGESLNNGDWVNEDNAGDLDFSTYAQSDLNSEFYGSGDYARMRIELGGTYTAYTGQTLTADKVYGKVDYSENTANGSSFTFKVGYVIGSLSDCKSFTSSQLNLLHTQASSYGQYPDIWVNHQLDTLGAIGDYSTAKVFHVFQEIQYQITEGELGDIYVACQGRKASTDVAAEFSGIIAGDLIEQPNHIAASILIDELGLTNISSTFSDADSDYSSWKIAPIIDGRINSKDFLEKLAFQSNAIIWWDANNVPAFDWFKSSYTTDYTFKIDEIKGLPKLSKIKLSEIVNDLKLNFQKGGSGNLQKQITRVDDRANVGSQAKYNAVMEKVIDADFIADETTAGLLADHWCKDDTDSFWSVQRNIVELETADIRGINYYNAGSFKPILTLELTDIIELDSEFDSYLKCNGESWSGKQFKIFELERRRTGLKIKAFEV
jgi:hypothetical protein